jgi:YidC/Oxa1 family membrane protein insertase
MRRLVPIVVAVGLFVLVAVAMFRTTSSRSADDPRVQDDAAAVDAVQDEQLGSGDAVERDDTEPSAAAVDADPPPPTPAATGPLAADPDPAGASPATQPAATADPAAATGPAATLRARPLDPPADTDVAAEDDADQRQALLDAHTATIGSATPGDELRMQVTIVPLHTGIQRIALSNYRRDVEDPETPYVLHGALRREHNGAVQVARPYAVYDLRVDGQRINDRLAWQLTDQSDGHATYEMVVVDEADQPVLTFRRTYRLAADSYDLHLDQELINHAGRPLDVSLAQYGQGDVTRDGAQYLGERRMLITAYFDPEHDPAQVRVFTDDQFLMRRNLVEDLGPLPGQRSGRWQRLWPHPDTPDAADLAWVASENRYFAVVTHGPLENIENTSQLRGLQAIFPEVDAFVFPDAASAPNLSDDDRSLVTTLGTGEFTIPAGQSRSLDLGIFAGPRERELLTSARYAPLQLDQLVRYELGCTWCTFQWLARLLLAFLEFIDGIVHDWGIAIVVLVLVVRLLLHPITKKAQVNMMKMGKQMASLQPEIEKLKSKHKDDPNKLNAEMMSLYRTKGVNPLGALGCLPMFLQMPIWVALYAMLYYAIELRHEPAFYGVFQAISGGAWPFLQDLSVSDKFIPLPGDGFTLTWIPFVKPHFGAINILPLLMGVTFFFNMKFTTPPPANDQQAQQQKIMRIMPFIFPIMLYSAPAGLTLYICASTFAGIIDSYLVRKHVRELEAEGKLFEKKPPKPGGFRDRLGKAMEQRQAMLQQQDTGPSTTPGGRGAKRAQRKKRR